MSLTAPSAPVTAPETPLDASGHPRFRYVVIEGPVGIGKTALAKRLAERWAMTPDFEYPETNPFLERFYRDPARYAFAVQSHFLLQRSAHAAAIASGVAPPVAAAPAAVAGQATPILTEQTASRAQGGTDADAPVIGDFLLQKDVIYARLNLDGDEFALYQRLAAKLAGPVRVPDLVIYLQASPETLYARLQKHSTGLALQVTDAYLRTLCDAYNQFFYHYSDGPLLTVNMDNLAPVEDESDLTLLIDHIHAMRGPREVFVKGSL